MPRHSATRENILVLSIAAGDSIEAAAEKSGIGERTVYRRLREPDFRQRVAEVKEQVWQQTVNALADAAIEAVGTLVELMRDGSAMARLGAARALLESRFRVRDLIEIENRIIALEQQNHENK